MKIGTSGKTQPLRRYSFSPKSVIVHMDQTYHGPSG